MKTRYLLILEIVFIVIYGYSISDDENDEVMRAIMSLEDSINWSYAHYRSIILDSIFSLRVVQGEVEYILDEAIGLSQSVRLRLMLLLERVEKLIGMSLESLKSSDDGYYEKLKYLIDKKYKIRSVYPARRELFPGGRKKGVIRQERAGKPLFNETESDNCMKEILGDDNTKPCSITEACYNIMTDLKGRNYQLTHQMIFFILAEVKHCGHSIEEIRKRKQHDLQKFQDGSLVRIYHALPALLDDKRYDLFSEMVMVGQILNYKEFNQKWFRELFYLWQDSSGCYMLENHLPESIHIHTKVFGRRLLAEEIIDQDCSAHFTAVVMICVTYVLSDLLLPSSYIHLPNSPYSSFVIITSILLLFLLLYTKVIRRSRLLGRIVRRII